MKNLLRSIKRSGSLIASLVVVAAVLPIVLVATLSEDLRLKSAASQRPELRVWTEPSTVIAKVGREVVLDVYAQAQPDELVVPMVKMRLGEKTGMRIEPQSVSYEKPFSGKVLVGRVTVVPAVAGEVEITIPIGQVYTSMADMQVVTKGAKVIVRN